MRIRVKAELLGRELSAALLSMVNAEGGYIEFESDIDGVDTLSDLMSDFLYQLCDEIEGRETENTGGLV